MGKHKLRRRGHTGGNRVTVDSRRARGLRRPGCDGTHSPRAATARHTRARPPSAVTRPKRAPSLAGEPSWLAAARSSAATQESSTTRMRSGGRPRPLFSAAWGRPAAEGGGKRVRRLSPREMNGNKAHRVYVDSPFRRTSSAGARGRRRGPRASREKTSRLSQPSSVRDVPRRPPSSSLRIEQIVRLRKQLPSSIRFGQMGSVPQAAPAWLRDAFVLLTPRR